MLSSFSPHQFMNLKQIHPSAIYVSACWIAAIFKPCGHLSGGPHKLDRCHWLKPLCQLERALYSDAKGLKRRSVMESAHKSKQKCLCEVQMFHQNWSMREESPQLQAYMALHIHMHKSCFKCFEQHWFDVFKQRQRQTFLIQTHTYSWKQNKISQWKMPAQLY